MRFICLSVLVGFIGVRAPPSLQLVPVTTSSKSAESCEELPDSVLLAADAETGVIIGDTKDAWGL